MRPPRPQPFHEPIGFSPEAFPTVRRWLALAVAVVAVLAGAILIALRFSGVL